MTLNGFQKIELLLIDSHPLFREGLKQVLEMDTALRIVAEGGDGEQLLPLYKQYSPDAVLMDVNLPGQRGMEALRDLTSHFPQSKVLVFTASDDFSYVSQAMKEGASGYLLKEMEPPSIINAIKTVVKGEMYLHPKITKDFLSELRKLDAGDNSKKFHQTSVRRPYHLLTYREVEILQLLAEGHSNKSLGETLEISEKTVKNHVSSLLRKMEIKDRTQAVVTALKNGWIELK